MILNHHLNNWIYYIILDFISLWKLKSLDLDYKITRFRVEKKKII